MTSAIRRGRVGLALGLTLTVLVVAGCSTDGEGDSGSSSAPPATPPSTPAAAPTAEESYGGYPSFLPSDTVGGGFGHRIVDASAAKPVVATQGDTVRVRIGGVSVRATVTGPDVPVSGLQYEAPSSAATWKVVLDHASAAVPIDPTTFQAIDERGSVYDLETRGRVPTVVRPGGSASFSLFAPAILTGEGRMRWTPQGHLAPVEWDFVVETD